MSADRVRFIEGVTAELAKHGCKKIEQIDEYNALYLVTDVNILISVPAFRDDRCPEAFWPDVLASVTRARTKPA